jgi:DNA ligase-1
MLLARLVSTSRRVSETRSRLEKIGAIASLLRGLAEDEIEIAVAWLSGELRQGRIGIGSSLLRSATSAAPAATAGLTLTEVDREFEALAAVRGARSTAERTVRLTRLFSRATRDEQDFLLRLIIGELRQGALEGIMLDAIAKAAELPASEVRRAAMMAGSVRAVARAGITEGAAGLSRFEIVLFTPVLPMLAQPAGGVAEALERLGSAIFEWKLDGARVQVHKRGSEVRIYTRNLREVSGSVPDIVEQTGALCAAECILDGEAIALKPEGRPHPFQITMQRFGRKLDVADMRGSLPLSVYFFDILFIDGASLIGHATRDRHAALEQTVPPRLLLPRLMTGHANEADRFLKHALACGHEGVMAKDPEASYEAGRRGGAWLKIKQAHTLDLVVLAAEWGHGRRRGFLSNLHLGARDPDGGGFVMLGKTFKGLTDAMLKWQTEKLLSLEVSRDPYTVYVRPELVVEIDFNDVQSSPHYPGGVALRFARVKGYRTDKSASEADTIATVKSLAAPLGDAGAPQS